MAPPILLYTTSCHVWELKKNQRFLSLSSLIKPPTLVVYDYKAQDVNFIHQEHVCHVCDIVVSKCHMTLAPQCHQSATRCVRTTIIKGGSYVNWKCI